MSTCHIDYCNSVQERWTRRRWHSALSSHGRLISPMTSPRTCTGQRYSCRYRCVLVDVGGPFAESVTCSRTGDTDTTVLACSPTVTTSRPAFSTALCNCNPLTTTPPPPLPPQPSAVADAASASSLAVYNTASSSSSLPVSLDQPFCYRYCNCHQAVKIGEGNRRTDHASQTIVVLPPAGSRP